MALVVVLVFVVGLVVVCLVVGSGSSAARGAEFGMRLRAHSSDAASGPAGSNTRGRARPCKVRSQCQRRRVHASRAQ
eukprot:9459785-Heterocapsa_arctica.AAC.1